MHIVHLANAYGPTSGGLRTTMHEMARRYAACGQQVTLVVAGPADNDEDLGGVRRVTIKAPVLPGSGGYRFILHRAKVFKVLKALDPDAVEVSDRATLRQVGVWAKQRGIPNLMWAHERLDGVLRAWGPPLITPAESMSDWHNRATAQMFDHIVCTTGFAQEEFLRIGMANTVRVPLGVDTDFFHPQRRDENLRARLLGNDDYLIFMASRLSPEKRPDIAVHALAELRSRGIKARLVIAGSGPREAYLRRHSWGLPVEFMGFIQSRVQIAQLQSSADVVFAPGPIETFGLAALEALAGGSAVVASNTSALREIIVSTAGLTARPNAVAFADAAQALLEIPSADRRNAARARAMEFTWDRSIEQTLALHGRVNATR